MSETLTAAAIDAPDEAQVAFDELYRESRDDVFAYVAGMLRDRGAAEDITMQAFERAYRRRRTFIPKRGSRRGWLFGIARNAALDELRRRKRQARMRAEPADATSVAQDSFAEHTERRASVAAALAGLEPAERELVALKFFAGLSNAEIAAVLAISESNAGSRLHRVINKLREACQ
jgi:RNA polymerase sigma-70 factor (ECF subfamily)